MTTERVTMDTEQATEQYRRSLSRVLLPEAVAVADALVWEDADAELVLYPGRATLDLEEGLIRVSLPVLTEQSGRADIVAVFATGTAATPAGMFAATQARPSGPDVVLDRWAEPLVAATWQALLDLAADAVAPASPTDLETGPGTLAIATAQRSFAVAR